MKSNVVRFPNRKPYLAYSRIDRAQDAENRAMRGTHGSGKRWFYAGLAIGVVVTLLALEGM